MSVRKNIAHYLKETQFKGKKFLIIGNDEMGELITEARGKKNTFIKLVSEQEDINLTKLERYDMAIWFGIEQLDIETAQKLANLVCSKVKFTVIVTPNYRKKAEETQCYLDCKSILTLKPYLCYFTRKGAGVYWIFKQKPTGQFTNSIVKKDGLPVFLDSLKIGKDGYYTFRKKQGKWQFFFVDPTYED